MLYPLVRKLERYGLLSEHEVRAIQSVPARLQEHERGDDIVRQGDSPSESVLIVSGLACRFKLLRGGTRQILALQVPGDFADLHSMYLRVLDHGLAALTHCKVARVSHDAIRALSDSYPRLAHAFAWDMAVDGAIQREWMTSTGRRTSYQRAAHLFSELLLRMRAVGLTDSDSYELPLSQADLADVFGISTVHANRVIQDLRRDRLITLQGKVLTVLDVERLRDVADFEPTYL